MKRKTELYNLVIEERSIGIENEELNVLKDKLVLVEFLDNYYAEAQLLEVSDIESDVVNEDGSETEESAITVNNEVIEEENRDLIRDIALKKINLKSKKICYNICDIENIECEKDIISSSRNISMNYVKYDKRLTVVEIDTFSDVYTKEKNQGDLEKQHYVIRTINNSNRGLIVWEKINGSVSIGSLRQHMNSCFRKWIREKYKDNKNERDYLLKYDLKVYAIPSKDFIEELENLDKISLINVTILKEKVTEDEDILYSEDNISREYVEIISKPKPKQSFSKSNVKAYFKKVKKKNNLKRMVIKGVRSGGSIALDTEFMKMSEYIEINENGDGLIDSVDLFVKYNDLADNYFDSYNEEIAEIEEIDDRLE
nr:hypothetical protein [uncultured Romboutsia sp.]